jgi:hypothetical protein
MYLSEYSFYSVEQSQPYFLVFRYLVWFIESALMTKEGIMVSNFLSVIPLFFENVLDYWLPGYSQTFYPSDMLG